MLTNIIDFALGKVKATNGWRPNVGTHAVDFVVRIRGFLKVGEDHDRAPTASIPLLPTVALLIHRMGITREAAEKALVETMTAALDANEKGADHIEELPWVVETMARVQAQIIEKLPKVSVKGPVTTKLVVGDVMDLTTEVC